MSGTKLIACDADIIGITCGMQSGVAGASVHFKVPARGRPRQGVEAFV